MRIQVNGGAIGLDGSLWRTLDQEKITSQAMAIIRVARLPSHRSLQIRKIRPGGEERAPEGAACKPYVSRHEQQGRQHQGKFPGRAIKRNSHVGVYRVRDCRKSADVRSTVTLCAARSGP